MLPQELQTDYAALLTPSDPEVQRLVKVADKLCGYLKAAREVQRGNGEFRAAEVALKAQVEQEMLPEVKYFLEHFAPSFFLSLDELQESHGERAGEG